MGFPFERCLKAYEYMGDDSEAMLQFLTSGL